MKIGTIIVGTCCLDASDSSWIRASFLLVLTDKESSFLNGLCDLLNPVLLTSRVRFGAVGDVLGILRVEVALITLNEFVVERVY